ncbi:MAG: hypothetical protein JST35_02415 [Armatimonadetes bacterium]|nr:hypothetical protein [Armatimonadota bacterium]
MTRLSVSLACLSLVAVGLAAPSIKINSKHPEFKAIRAVATKSCASGVSGGYTLGMEVTRLGGSWSFVSCSIKLDKGREGDGGYAGLFHKVKGKWTVVRWDVGSVPPDLNEWRAVKGVPKDLIPKN